MDTKLLLNAIVYSADKHKFQQRKSNNSSYICHPLEVAQILLNCDVNDIDIIVSAVLHDVVEDTTATNKEIRELFGDTIADYVYEVTDDRTLSKVERKKLQIEHGKVISDGAKLIKAADAYHNINDMISNPPKGWTKENIYGYAVWKKVVTNNLRGVNLELDSKLDDLFSKILKEDIDIDVELEKYFTSMEQ